MAARFGSLVARRGAELLIGTHDFTAFTPTETEHKRFERSVIRAEWRVEGDLLAFWIESDTFLRHMNRILVGTMLEGGRGAARVLPVRGPARR